MISNICLSPLVSEDRLVWRYTNDGTFYVKSAYHLQLELYGRNPCSSSLGNNEERCWMNIWQSNTLPVVKTFMWKAFYNILPTKQNLKLKNVVRDALYHICESVEESIEHILWECPSANDVWSICCKELQKCRLIGLRFMEIVMYLEGFLDIV